MYDIDLVTVGGIPEQRTISIGGTKVFNVSI